MWGENVQQYVPLAGVAAAVTIWLRQYWFQQRLTNEIVDKLRSDNDALRKENLRLNRENTVLRSRADEVDLQLLEELHRTHDHEEK